MLSIFSRKRRKNDALAAKRAAYRAGVLAEHAVCVYLTVAGYRILARRLQTPGGEIDILARRRSVLLAAEVKYRKHESADVVPMGQRMRLIAATEYALYTYGKGNMQIQRDVFLVGKMSFRRIRDAF